MRWLAIAPWWRSSPVIAEVISALGLATWGLVLLLPTDTYSTSQGYRVMSTLLSENQLSALALAGWMLQSLGVCWKAPYCRAFGAYMAFALWSFAAFVFLRANPWSHAPYMYGILALSQAYAIFMTDYDNADAGYV